MGTFRTLFALLLIMHAACRSSKDLNSAQKDANQPLENEKKFAVVGYLPEWRYGGVDWEAISDHLTHLIFFSIEVDKEGSFAAMDRCARSLFFTNAFFFR